MSYVSEFEQSSSGAPQQESSTLRRWLPFGRTAARPRIRLLCFHHAGGNALVYRSWGKALPDWLDVCPVQLPGRGARIAEPPFTDMRDMVAGFAHDAASLFDRPLALFGHSMGAAVAFALAQRLGSQVVHVFAAARAAPSEPYSQGLRDLDDASLIRYLAKLGATPPIVFQEPELLAHVLTVLRADMTLNNSYRNDRQLATTPLTVLGGTADCELPPQALERWRSLTAGRFQCVMFPGDHFFLSSCLPDVHRLIVESLEGAAP